MQISYYLNINDTNDFVHPILRTFQKYTIMNIITRNGNYISYVGKWWSKALTGMTRCIADER